MSTTGFPKSLEDAHAFDAADPLAAHRNAFSMPEGVTYLVGHSLGAAPVKALKQANTTAGTDWACDIVGSWNTADWINLPQTTGAKIAPLLGVASDEVIVCDSVSLNLFKLASALLETGRHKRRLIVEREEFPTDQYMMAKLAGLIGAEHVHTDAGGGLPALKDGGILVKSLVDFRTGHIADLSAHEEAARASGGAIIWDLSHATGVLNLRLADWGASYAVGCTYKYLNGGPGAPGFIYVSRDKQNELSTPLPGWLGHANAFAFEDEYTPADGLKRFISGTPPILSLATLNAALDAFDGVNQAHLQAKANRLGDMCLHVFEELGLASTSPPEGSPRGGHVSVCHPEGYAISRALADQGIKTDYRPPDTIRFGLSPLYLSYSEVWSALDTFRDILARETWRDPKYQVRAIVT